MDPLLIPARLILLLVTFGITVPNCRPIAASPNPHPRLHERAMESISETMPTVNLTRQHEGDVFSANALLSTTCDTDTCVGLSSGTAGLFPTAGGTEILSGHEFHSGSEKCQCRCLQHLNTYREDLGICVDDIHECTLSPFVSGSSSEKIPFVFLPLRGQIIHPSREINFPGVRTPVCAVTGAQYLGQKGWSELRNPIDTDVPFRLFRDEGRTFLQWLGEADLRHKMQGRLILVHMMCRDMSLTGHKNPKANDEIGSKNIFTPCVAFRVNGSPVRYVNNVPEVLFQSEMNSNLSAPPEGFHTKEYIVIGICSLLLGLIYVASVFLYLHVKKRKNQLAESRLAGPGTDSKNDINYPKNDQITFGAPFSRSESFYNSANLNDTRTRSNLMGNGLGTDDLGIIKNNPLLKHFPNLNDNSGFISDRSNSNSECEDAHIKLSDRTKNLQTSAIIHPLNNGSQQDYDRGNISDASSSPTQENECLPEANVSITEEMGQDDKLDNMRAIVNGTVRKKLYFNPAYFEPHLLLSPPPAAIEFLTKIREVISIAKYKMATKRYQPSLNIIPEEHQAHNPDFYVKGNITRSNTISPKAESSNRLVCAGCPGCAEHYNSQNPDTPAKCDNCGDKHNSIQKWLEGVPFNENHLQDDRNAQVSESHTLRKIEEISDEKSSTSKESQPPAKKKPPPLPLTTPKIISHSLKNHVQKNTASSEQPIYIKTSNIDSKSVDSSTSPTKLDSSIYSFGKNSNEIYNNPKFLESPQLSQRSRTSSTCRTRSSRKNLEVLDQYSNPGKEKQMHYEMLKSIQHMPDMVYEALAKDYSIRNFSNDKNNPHLYSIPTPDYDGTYNKKMKEIYNNNSHSSDPFVPTPDYSTMGKRSLRQYQPDSPIYRRKSPQYLIVDYETDSLERGSSSKKDCNSSSSPLSNTSSDISSQPSPSLSTALPLEEEVEIHHTVYDKVEGFRKDGDITAKKRVPTEYESVKIRPKKESPPRIKYDTPFRGSMTIEVGHEPQSDELSTDSDQFEPDTLDRKPKKPNSSSIRSMNAWTEYLNKSQSFVNSNDKVSYSSLENMTSLPEFTNKPTGNEQLVLRSSSSFRSNPGQFWSSGKIKASENQHTIKPNFGSLREIYQSKVQQQSYRPKLTNVDFKSEQGRILTLEAKHSRRQRRDISDTIKKIMPPDVIPTDNSFYDTPRTPEKVLDGIIVRKNLPGWNTDDLSRNDSKNLDNPSQEDTDTISDHSESTEVTGVSETQINSDNLNAKMNKQNLSSSLNYPRNDSILQIDYSAMYNHQQRAKQADGSYISVRIGNNNNNAPYQRYNFNNNKIYTMSETIDENTKQIKDIDRIENISVGAREVHGSPQRNEIEQHLNVQRVYRVEIPSPSNGMQIAMGLRDRAKKSKDLKNAWKKFVSMATSKFGGSPSPDKTNLRDCDDHKSVLSDYMDRDEGISSLIDEHGRIVGIRRSRTSGGSLEKRRKNPNPHKCNVMRSHSSFFDQRFGGGYRQEMDSGYISGDSNECKAYTRRVYERYNFKTKSDRENSPQIETINDSESRNFATRRRPQTPKAKLHSANARQNRQQTNNAQNNAQLGFNNKPIEVNVYSSDDEPYASPCPSTDSEDEGNTEDMCESGAESVETHSVLFKNIRNNQQNNAS